MELTQVRMPDDLTGSVFLSQRVDKMTSEHMCQSLHNHPGLVLKSLHAPLSQQLQLESQIDHHGLTCSAQRPRLAKHMSGFLADWFNRRWISRPLLHNITSQSTFTGSIHPNQLGHVTILSEPDNTEHRQQDRTESQYRR